MDGVLAVKVSATVGDIREQLTMNTPAVKAAIVARLRARREREAKQFQLLDNIEDYAETIRSKLEGRLETNQFFNFSRCGHDEIFKTCVACGKWETFYYRCNLKWCPRCQQRLGLIRRNLISLWAKRISQPKHLILTHKNFPVLTRKKYREHTKRLAKLRRAKCFEAVRGGCCSTETTHEEQGWHVHAHLLLDVNWLDMPEVARAWAALNGQEFAIVKIKDVRDKEYLQEICKYVVEGSELAKWPAELINEFVQAQRGLRMFSSFGSLREMAPEIRREIHANAPEREPCACGCEDFIYEDETAVTIREAEKLEHLNKRSRHHAAAFQQMRDAAAGTDEAPSTLSLNL